MRIKRLGGELRPCFVFGIALTLFACSGTPDTVPPPSQPTQAITPPAGTEQEHSVYRVRAGDTLYSIARRHGVSPEQLQIINNISDPRELDIGQQLRIPGKGAAPKSRFIWPVERIDISSGFGARRNHSGVDLRAPRGTPIRAAAGGVVNFVGTKRGYGKMVVIKHDKTFQTLYAHNLHNKVREGEWVKQGQTIATVGISGNATGYHVHFEVIVNDKPANPRRYVGN